MLILRYITRNMGKTALIVFLFALSISLMSLVGNIEAAGIEATKQEAVKYSRPDVIIYTNYSLSREVADGVKKFEGVLETDVRIYLSGYTILGDEYVITPILGIDAEPRLDRVEGFSDWSGFTGNVCLLDEVMADRFGIRPGDELEIFTPNGTMSLKVLATVDASWTISANVPPVIYLFAPADSLKEFLGVPGYNTLLILTDGSVNRTELVRRVTDYLEDRGVSVLTAFVRDFSQSPMQGVSEAFMVFMIPTAVLASLILAVSMLYDIAKNYRTYAVMKSIGFTGGQLAADLYKKALLLFALSIPVAYGMSYAVTWIGLKVALGKFGYSFLPAVNTRFFIQSSIIALIMLVIMMLLPAVRVSRLNEASALRYGFESYKPPRRSLGEFLSGIPLLALRNIGRHRRKSFLILLMLVIGSAVAAGTYVSASVMKRTMSKSISAGCDLVVFLHEPITAKDAGSLENLSSVDAVEPAIFMNVRISNISMAVNGRNVTPPRIIIRYYAFIFVPKERKVFATDMVDGRLPRSPGEVAILAKLAFVLGVRVGDRIRIRVMNSTLYLKVVGIANFLWMNGGGMILVDEDAFQHDLYGDGYYNTLFIRTSGDVKSAIKDIMKSDLRVGSVLIMKAAEEELHATVISAVYSFIGLLATMIALMTVSSLSVFMFLTYVGRSRELALYECLGGTKLDLIKLVATESAMMVLIASLPTAVLGALFTSYMLASINSLAFPIYGLLPSPAEPIVTSVTLLAASAFSAIIPTAIYIVRLKTSEFVRYE